MRKRISWLDALVKVVDDEKKKYFFELFYKNQKNGKRMSANRCAYYTLKHFCSTTTIDELCEKLGL